MDTCHAYTRGYDVSSVKGVEETLLKIEETFGLDKVKLVHLNDSKGELGSRMDRHNHIGMGYIGEEGFRNFLASKFSTKPLILETPVDETRSDADNLLKVRELAG